MACEYIHTSTTIFLFFLGNSQMILLHQAPDFLRFSVILAPFPKVTFQHTQTSTVGNSGECASRAGSKCRPFLKLKADPFTTKTTKTTTKTTTTTTTTTTATTTPDPPQFYVPERDVGHSLHRASESSQSALANLSRMGLEQMMVMSDDNQLTNSRINLPFQRQPIKTVESIESIVSQGTCCLVWRGCTHQHWRIPHLSSVYPSWNHRWTGWWFAPGCRGLEMIETSKVQGHGVLRIYCLPLSEDLQAPKKPERSFTLQLGLSATCIALSL